MAIRRPAPPRSPDFFLKFKRYRSTTGNVEESIQWMSTARVTSEILDYMTFDSPWEIGTSVLVWVEVTWKVIKKSQSTKVTDYWRPLPRTFVIGACVKRPLAGFLCDWYPASASQVYLRAWCLTTCTPVHRMYGWVLWLFWLAPPEQMGCLSGTLKHYWI